MSSITRFIKQVPSSSSYLSASALTTSNVYEFVKSASNVVGNYPPGFVQTLATAGTALPAYPMARDLGKTIFAQVGSSGNYGWFRQIQLLNPAPITSFIGGATGSTFGVVFGSAAPDAYTSYGTFYIPITIGGMSVIPDAAGSMRNGQM